MLRLSCRRLAWIGGTAVKQPVPGTNMQPDYQRIINTERALVSEDWSVEPEAMSGNYQPWRWERTVRELRADLYDELLKLPLRYKMHPYAKLEAAMSKSAVGYAAPLGPADPLDTLPFFVHRDGNGRFYSSIKSLAPKLGLPSYVMTLSRIDGDLFRLEDELIKIFPDKKIFVTASHIKVFAAAEDARAITEHWMLGLGF